MSYENIMHRLKKVSRKQIALAAIVFLAWGLLLTLHGLLPHMSNAPSTYITSVGYIECGDREPLELIRARCTLMGGSAGSPIPQGLPFYVPAVLILKVFWLSPAMAFSVTASVVMVLAFFGGYKFFGLATQSKYLALFGAFIYLVSPFIFSLRNFGGTYWAFLLIPFFLFVAWKLIRLRNMSHKQLLGSGAIWCLWAAALLFLDGYSFVLCVIFVYILLGGLYLKEKDKQANWLLQGVLVFIGLLVAYALYTKLLPTGSFGKSSLALFRAMGLDVSTIFIPTSGTWLASLLHMGADWKKLWGDGSNTNNYIGIFLLLSFISGIYYSLKKNKLSGLKLAIIVAGLFGLVFAMGPAIKINSQKPDNTTLTKSYEMPQSAAIPNLPVAAIDRYVPGFSTMRATYRWFALTELAIVFFAVIGLEVLLARKRIKASVAISILIIIDLMPNPHLVIAANIARYDQNQQFNTEVIDPLKRVVRPNERALIYPNTAGSNDYLASYMVPLLGIRTYNLADDKAVNYARKQWPGPILDLMLHPDFSVNDKARLIRMSFDQNDISLLIIPQFDLRWDSYSWPPAKDYPDRQILAQALRATGEFMITDYGRFMIVRTNN